MFLETLEREISFCHSKEPFSKAFFEQPLKTVYIGGGTPSRLDLNQFHRVVNTLHEYFDLSRLEEFTVEVNPEDLSQGWLKGLKNLGVTRLSMGVQTFQPDLLKLMHRAHSSVQAHRALELIAETGFETYSVDLIYGNPGQTTRQLESDLESLLPYAPPHISAYSLTIEPKTRLGKQYQLGRIHPADEDLVSEQSDVLQSWLESHGIHRYEISNYARKGHHAIHNSAYWQHVPYLGLGPASHTFYWLKEKKAAVRKFQPADIHAWRNQLFSDSQANPENCIETLDFATLARERIMLALRTKAGVSQEELTTRYDYILSGYQTESIRQLRKKGLMEPEAPLRLTDKGMAIADAITQQLI